MLRRVIWLAGAAVVLADAIYLEFVIDKHIAIHALAEFKKLAPLRQIEAAELMVALNKYTIGYAKSLVAATSPAHLVAA